MIALVAKLALIWVPMAWLTVEYDMTSVPAAFIAIAAGAATSRVCFGYLDRP